MLGYAKASSSVRGAWSQAALITAIAAICVMWMMSPALAQNGPDFSPTDAWSLFGTQYGDAFTSVFLNQIFGPLFPSASGGNVTTVFSILIGYFNVIILVIGGLMFFWNITVGIMQSAHEGSVLGQRWSSLWAPLRVIAAVGMLVPVPGLGGYNLAQSGVAYNVKAATNIASFFWGKTAELVIKDDVAISTVAPTIPATVVQKIWDNAVCKYVTDIQMGIAGDAAGAAMSVGSEQQTYTQRINKVLESLSNTPYSVHPDMQAIYRDDGTVVVSSFLANTDLGTETNYGVCGSYKTPEIPNYITGTTPLPDQNIGVSVMMDYNADIANKFSQTHLDAYNSLVSDFTAIIQANAAAISDPSAEIPNVQKDMASAVFKANSTLAAGIDEVMTLTKDADKVGDTARDRMLTRITGSCATQSDASKIGDTEQCYGEGWVGAGSWYMMMARLNNELSTLVTAKATVVGPQAYNPLALYESTGDKQGVWGWLWGDDPAADAGMLSEEEFAVMSTRFTDMFRQSTIALASLGFSMSSTELDELNSATEADMFFSSIPGWFGFNGLVELMISTTSPSSWAGDPMIGIIEIGNAMLHMAAVLFGVQFLAGASVLGNTIVPPGTATALAAPVAAMIGAGVTLSFVIPMIPFIIWIMAVTGYFLLVVEAVIAVNLWALSHLRMDGEGISGEAGRQGWLMILAIFMTPTLMIFGYLVGMTIFRVTSSLVDIGLNQAATGILGGGIFITLMAVILYGIMICAIYFAILERSFSLITELPDRVMKWMGAHVSIQADTGTAKKAIIGGIAGAGMAGAQSMKVGRSAGAASSKTIGNLFNKVGIGGPQNGNGGDTK